MSSTVLNNLNIRKFPNRAALKAATGIDANDLVVVTDNSEAVLQINTMPTPCESMLGEIYMSTHSVNASDLSYKRGYFYECVGGTTPASATIAQTIGSDLTDLTVDIATFEAMEQPSGDENTTFVYTKMTGEIQFTSFGSASITGGSLADLKAIFADDGVTWISTFEQGTYFYRPDDSAYGFGPLDRSGFWAYCTPEHLQERGFILTGDITNGDYIEYQVIGDDLGEWKHNSNTVNPVDYGISYAGTPSNGDELTIIYIAEISSYRWQQLNTQPTPQVEVLPTATANNENQIYQYTGETQNGYINGYFYKNNLITTPSSAGIYQSQGSSLTGLAVDVTTFEQTEQPVSDESVDFVYKNISRSVNPTSFTIDGVSIEINESTFLSFLDSTGIDRRDDTITIEISSVDFNELVFMITFLDTEGNSHWYENPTDWGITYTGMVSELNQWYNGTVTVNDALNGWYKNGNQEVDITNYGITYVGTPQNDDTLTVDYVAETNEYTWQQHNTQPGIEYTAGNGININDGEIAVTDRVVINNAQNDQSFAIAGATDVSSLPTSAPNRFNVVIGDGASTGQFANSNNVIIGRNARGGTSSGGGTVVIGSGASANYDNSVAIGYNAKSIGTINGNSVAIGPNTEVNTTWESGKGVGGNIAIGYNAKASGVGGSKIQIGNGTNTEYNTAQIWNYRILDRDGTIPSDRLAYAINKYLSMPTASADNLGWIIQYTGTTDANYTHGYIYECDGAPAGASITNVNVAGSIAVTNQPLFDSCCSSMGYGSFSDGVTYSAADNHWTWNGPEVSGEPPIYDLEFEMGITYTGTPQDGDSFGVVYNTESTYAWTQVDVQPASEALPDQSGQNGKFLTTDGTDASWSDKPLVNNTTGTNNITISSITSTPNNSVFLGTNSGVVTGATLPRDIVCIGAQAKSSSSSVVIGTYAQGNGIQPIAIGNSSSVGTNTDRSIAFGYGAIVSNNTKDSVQIGTGTNSESSTFCWGTHYNNSYVNYKLVDGDGTIPTDRFTTTPSADGTYVPILSVSSGTATRSWSQPVVATFRTWEANE